MLAFTQQGAHRACSTPAPGTRARCEGRLVFCINVGLLALLSEDDGPNLRFDILGFAETETGGNGLFALRFLLSF